MYVFMVEIERRSHTLSKRVKFIEELSDNKNPSTIAYLFNKVPNSEGVWGYDSTEWVRCDDLMPCQKDEAYVAYAEGEYECVGSINGARDHIRAACFDGSEWSPNTDHAFIAKVVETVSFYKNDVRENHPCPHGRPYCDELCEKGVAEKCEDSNPWYSEHDCSYDIEFRKV